MFNGVSAYSGPAKRAYVNQLHFTGLFFLSRHCSPCRGRQYSCTAINDVANSAMFITAQSRVKKKLCISILNCVVWSQGLQIWRQWTRSPQFHPLFISTTYAPKISSNTNFPTLSLKWFFSKRVFRQNLVGIHHLSILATTPAHHTLHDCTTLIILAAL